MLKALMILVLIGVAACNGNEADQPAPSPGVLENTQQSNTADTSALVTDSTVVPDSNTSDIEPMKKIN